jgi:hypothetical protein
VRTNNRRAVVAAFHDWKSHERERSTSHGHERWRLGLMIYALETIHQRAERCSRKCRPEPYRPRDTSFSSSQQPRSRACQSRTTSGRSRRSISFSRSHHDLSINAGCFGHCSRVTRSASCAADLRGELSDDRACRTVRRALEARCARGVRARQLSKRADRVSVGLPDEQREHGLRAVHVSQGAELSGASGSRRNGR